MLFVGHISLAFIIVFLITEKFPHLKKSVSIALVMLLSILPDVDVVFRLVGLEFGHRTFTHSPIIWLIIGGILVCFSTKKHVKGLVTIYAISYVTHIVGDALVGPINIIYPFGELLVISSIKAWSLLHLTIEASLLALMSAIIIIRSHLLRRNNGIVLFHYRGPDGFFYLVLLSALIVSLFYILNRSEITYSLFASNDVAVKIIFLILLHLSAASVVILLWWLTLTNTRRPRHVTLN